MRIFFLLFLSWIHLLSFDFGGVLNSVVQNSLQKESNTQELNSYQPAGYDSLLSLTLAKLADGVFKKDFGKNAFIANDFSYDGHLEKKSGLVDLQFAYGHRALSSNRLNIVIAIRGSKEDLDWVTDAYYIATPYNEKIDEKLSVHSGFLDSARMLEASEVDAFIEGKTLRDLINLNIKGSRNDLFYITGHSLGGAVATIYSTILIDRGLKKENLLTYTYGAPPVSMDEGALKNSIHSLGLDGKLSSFGQIVQGVLSGYSNQSDTGTNYYIERYNGKVNIYRVYDKNDIVTKMMPPARHLGTPVPFDSNLKSGDYLSPQKIWRLHFMDNYFNHINGNKIVAP